MTRQNELTAEYDAILDSIIDHMLLLDLAEESENEKNIEIRMNKLQSQIDRRDRCVAEVEALGGYIEQAVVFFP